MSRFSYFANFYHDERMLQLIVLIDDFLFLKALNRWCQEGMRKEGDNGEIKERDKRQYWKFHYNYWKC